MVYRLISADTKYAAIRMYNANVLELDQICYFLGMSESTFWRSLRLWRKTGYVSKPRSTTRGRPRVLHFDDIHYLIRIIEHRPNLFLDELQHLLATNRFISTHFTTVFRTLEQAGVSRKKLQKIAMERNEDLRADFIRRMAQYLPEQLGFMDEVSKDERTGWRAQGCAPRGFRAEMKGVFIRGQRLSAEGLLTMDGMMANTVIQGLFTFKRFHYHFVHVIVRSREDFGQCSVFLSLFLCFSSHCALRFLEF
jgi:transposase